MAEKISTDVAHEAASDVLSDVADLAADVAKKELERRHPGLVEEKGAAPKIFAKAVTLEEIEDGVGEADSSAALRNDRQK